MKKYRLTKITVKTKEIISITKQANDSLCPICHQPFSALVPADESSADAPDVEERTAELPTAKMCGDQNQKS